MTRALVLVCLMFQTLPPAPPQTPPPATTQTPPKPVVPPAPPARPSVVTRIVEAPIGNLGIIYYDESVLFVSRAFGERDGSPQPEPGLFVHSKEKSRWLQITAVSTIGAKLGRSWSDDPKVQQKMRSAPVSWDFTPYGARPYIDLPLRTSASIALPDKVTVDVAADQYELRFFAAYGPPAETVLYVKRVDLQNAFAGRK